MLAVGIGVALGVGVALGSGVWLAVGVGLGINVCVGVGVALGVNVWVGVGVALGVLLGVGVRLGVTVGEGVAVPGTTGQISNWLIHSVRSRLLSWSSPITISQCSPGWNRSPPVHWFLLPQVWHGSLTFLPDNGLAQLLPPKPQ